MRGTAGANILFISVFGNALDLVRVLTLTVAGTPHVLGAAGESWLRALGGKQQAVMLSIGALLGWILVPFAVASLIQTKRDL